VFVDLASGATFPAPASLGIDRAVQALTAAFGLSAGDIQAILDTIATPAPGANALSLDLLSTLFRHARLASSLSLSIPDLLLWITLTEATPFSDPEATVEFLRRLGVLQTTGLASADLDYLLRHRSEAGTALAFTAADAAAVFKSLRNAVAKLPAVALGDAHRVHNLVTQALATALSATANVVDPVLAKTGILPLDSATIADLLAKLSDGTYQFDASHFPLLGAAFTRVAKATRLFGALRATEITLAFVVDHAGDFGWLDASTLPLAAATPSRFTGFERLLSALALDRRQHDRTPKLFDVLAARLTAPPADATTAIAALAPALAARAVDVTGVATAVGAVALDGSAVLRETPAGSLADVSVLASITGALDVIARYGMSGEALVLLSGGMPAQDTAAAARSAFQAQYDQRQWLDVIQPIEDALRLERRDALVAFLRAQRPGLGLPAPADRGFLSVDEMFGYYLIDPEMSCCSITTRLLQASLTIQQFVQRCYLGLEAPIKVDATVDHGWNEWSWRKQFRLWQANRQVFLYPENYLLPELRRDKSSVFSELESDLRQGNVDADAAEGALEGYLRKLTELSKLVVSAHYHETKPDGSRVLHVFAHTRGTPARWYYRQRAETHYGHGAWTAWETLHLDINSDHVLPLIWDRRLHLVWATFKAETAQEGSQSNPTGSTASPAKKLWAIEFSMSERRAGQWQPKRTLAEKMFFGSVTPQQLPPPWQFQFRVFVDSASNLHIQLYAFGDLIGTALLTSSDDPLRVTQQLGYYLLPSSSEIDASREPSFSLVAQTSSTDWDASLTLPAGYSFWGQDFVYDYRSTSSIGTSVPLNVLSASGKSPPVSVTLLGAIQSPQIVIPQQEPVFDSADPFFVSDVARVFFVQPHYYTVSSSPQELDALAYIPQWTTQYAFSPFYHPFARTFLRELEVGGVDQLMRRDLQKAPETVRGSHFDFKIYDPKPAVSSKPPLGYPVEDVDFSTEGAYSLYNWELFYHAPMFVASLLMANHRHEEAMGWLGYIFDPTDASSDDAPGRYWRTLPLNRMQQSDWLKQQIDGFLTVLAVDKKLGIADPDAAAVQDWIDHPFDPHRIARLRIGAYGKAAVMKLLDNLIAWGDALFGQDTMESVNQAEQLYVLASMILGPAPDRVRLPAKDQPIDARTATYASIKADLDQFSNALVDIENVVHVPPPSLSLTTTATPRPSLPQIALGAGETLFFCIPPNDTLLAYWDTVADRLDKIRNCKNLVGTVRQLALYAPPINPLLLIQAGGTGGSLSALGTTYQPIYRFATYLQRANELVADVRSFGALVLSALEKKDGESLSVLRTGQELDVLTRTRDVKVLQLTETSDQIAALRRQKEVTTLRRDFYRDIQFMNASEIIAISLQGAALVANAAAVVLDLVAGGAHVVPQFTGGAAGFGGSPMVTVTEGGDQVGSAASAWATGLRGVAGILSEGGQIASTIGSYQRRADEWDLQRRTADAELVQLDAQLVAATDRQTIATTELALHDRQIDNATAVDDFMTSKYTNGELYDFMLTRLTTVHTQAYQLAVDLAQRANAAYNYELGTTDLFIKPDYWDSQHQGLLAAEGLLFDLRRMEASYLDANARELELTKHVSLALTQPASLVALRETGSATIDMPEELFDRDHPGHYFRRIRSVAVTIPCVTGPYTGVNATLTLVSSYYRSSAVITPGSYPNPTATNVVSTGSGGNSQLATSSGQNDAGLFDANLHDERWLPFEGKGAASTWAFELRAEDNAFDPSTITDVVLHVRYTARQGGNADAVRAAIKPKNTRAILVSARDTFADAYYRFFHPASAGATEQTLSLPLLSPLFPFSNLGAPQISSIDVYVVSSIQPSGTMAATFGPDGGAATALAFIAGPGAGPSWTLKGAATLSAAHPGPFSLTLPVASVPSSLAASGTGLLDAAKLKDILLVVSYKIA
jgi:Tc toxin complex TcA C-terminal TcB-binding domain/Neuraminidase-like domain